MFSFVKKSTPYKMVNGLKHRRTQSSVDFPSFWDSDEYDCPGGEIICLAQKKDVMSYDLIH